MIQALKIGNPSLRGPCSDQLSLAFQSGRFHIKNFIFSFLKIWKIGLIM